MTLFWPILDLSSPVCHLMTWWHWRGTPPPPPGVTWHLHFFFWNRKFSLKNCLNIVQDFGKNVTWHIGEPPPSLLWYSVTLFFTKSVTYYLNDPLARPNKLHFLAENLTFFSTMKWKKIKELIIAFLFNFYL